MNRKQKWLLLAYAIIFVAVSVNGFNRYWDTAGGNSGGDWDSGLSLAASAAFYAASNTLIHCTSVLGIIAVILAVSIYLGQRDKKK